MNRLRLSLLLMAVYLPSAVISAPMVELFTSQGCYSCPPADDHLAAIIAEQPDVVALEYHVDYWDDLNYGAAGIWKDPFSDPSYTLRQRRYNSLDLAGQTGVYTPQMIVNGRNAQVGSKRRPVQRAINAKPPKVGIVAQVIDGQLSVEIKNSQKQGSVVWLAVFDRYQSTDVPRGENHGKTMVNHHVVRKLISLDNWEGKKRRYQFDVASLNLDDDNIGCAVFLQDESLGVVSGATYCE